MMMFSSIDVLALEILDVERATYSSSSPSSPLPNYYYTPESHHDEDQDQVFPLSNKNNGPPTPSISEMSKICRDKAFDICTEMKPCTDDPEFARCFEDMYNACLQSIFKQATS